ncbi:MAG: hypothetical protein IJD10_05990, partial [Clostridia bacterium]|nr:hypothetical protein [Clostridia bacterium]
MKKLLSLLLTMAMLASFLPTVVVSAEGTTDETISQQETVTEPAAETETESTVTESETEFTLVGSYKPVIVPATAELDPFDVLTFSISNNEARITNCISSASGVLTIPSTYNGYPVTSIG